MSNKIMYFSRSPSKSQAQSSQGTNVIIPSDCPPHLVKLMQQQNCFTCGQIGHWCRYCPSKSPNSNSVSPSPNQVSPLAPNAVQCRCGHGACEIKTARTGRNYYTCPIKSGVKCNDSFKWCDEPVAESDLQPPAIKYPECACKAGVCRRVKGKETDGVFKYYFTCPVKKGHGSCGYCVWEDEIKLLDGISIVPTKRSRQRTLYDFWEGCQNDETDNELGSERRKRMRAEHCSEDPSAVADIPDKEDFMVDDDDFEFINSLSREIVEEEAFLSLSQLSTTSRFRWRQIMFERRISSDDSFGIFPSFNPIIVPKQRNVSDGPCNKLAIKNVSQQHAQLSTGLVSPSKLQYGERKSKASWHREMILFTQQQLLAGLETLAPQEHESMKEAAETTFAILNVLQVDYKKFSDHVLDYISFSSSIAEIDKSMENLLIMEDLNKLFEEEKMRLAQLQDNHVKTKASLEASKRHRQLLCEEVSNLEAMLNEKQNQLKFCEEREAKQIAAQEALQKAKLELENS
ncbi:uncharacterized protein LOC106753695 isoform X3 [Vigna radiata var. radiata]|uniref:Uncharacterized protein LOC106753695 isoform X3 n=1 Tax=Vigna radiata var. radiata TaxID=3916 RepID=A0A1S3TB96_VIGRR|nr:uncharacterized protein LOC106753695 isoform X3 [Vigna radiata var. radiata]